MTWLEFDSLVNARDVGGTPTTDGGQIRPNRLLRSDNLQDLTPADVDRLIELGLTDVIDLRSAYEVHHTGDGPLVGDPRVRIHHYSFIPERYDARDQNDPEDVLPDNTDGAGQELPGDALPFAGKKPTVTVDDAFASTYLSFLAERPESVLAALRAIANAEGAALVHCAAGKDRTGTTVALALLLAGAEEDAVIADYAASSERMPQIIERLLGSDTYRENLDGRDIDSHLTKPETMRAFLAYADREHGGIEPMLESLGWTAADTAKLRGKLCD
ncbi:protein tyrosine phosphatase [Enemella evansiae]|uniref:tyrosine-protein phosphatase n=1 Tax=Enemella evansiae TaxID=2016499 RepID=UPI000B962BF1|nr:tyrosine-protein phosphatase [Enemella evansiae]OYO13986.1 protein tyrosine phosphatase [Enemella evansiae]